MGGEGARDRGREVSVVFRAISLWGVAFCLRWASGLRCWRVGVRKGVGVGVVYGWVSGRAGSPGWGGVLGFLGGGSCRGGAGRGWVGGRLVEVGVAVEVGSWPGWGVVASGWVAGPGWADE